MDQAVEVSTTDVHIYRTSDQRVLDVWDANQRNYDEYLERRRVQLEAWGFERDIAIYTSNSAFGGARWEGIAWPEDQDPPQYWRRDRNTPSMIVPRRSGAGKRIGNEFSALMQVPSPRGDLAKVGMPSMVMRGESGGMYVNTYAAKRCEEIVNGLRKDVVWVRWNIDPNPQQESEDGDRHAFVDTDVWELIKLSEYYAMVEAGNDPFGKNEGEDDDGP